MKITTILVFTLLAFLIPSISAEFPAFFKADKSYKIHLSDGRYFVEARIVSKSTHQHWVEITYMRTGALNANPRISHIPSSEKTGSIWINLNQVTCIKEIKKEEPKAEQDHDDASK